MARSQPIVYTLSHSVNHSVTTSHTPPPSLLTCSFLYPNSLTQIFTLFQHTPVIRQVSVPSSASSQQLSNSSPRQTLHAQFNEVNFMTTIILFTPTPLDDNITRRSNLQTQTKYLLSLCFLAQLLRTYSNIANALRCYFLENTS